MGKFHFWIPALGTLGPLAIHAPLGVGEALAPLRAAIASTNAVNNSDVRSRRIMVDRWEFTFIAVS